ncbi:MAG: hypothetical protein HQL60_04430 [Magnetococcales bacterium]|nr:hypothetical protein [Magnetococcales bacterium]
MSEPAKKCPACKKGTPLWMVSWADMVTLLLCFFIIIVAFSSMSKAKFEEVSGTFKDAFGVQRIRPMSPILSGYNPVAAEFYQEINLVQLKEKLDLVFERLVDGGDADVSNDENGYMVRIKKSQLFSGKGGAELQGSMLPLLQQFTTAVAMLPNMISVTAHAATAEEWSTAASQSAAVVTMLVTKGGLDPHRLQAVAAGSNEPAPSPSSQKKRGAAEEPYIEILVTKKIPNLVDNADRGSATGALPDGLDALKP